MYGAKLTTCICPKCNCKHRIKIKWSGKGVPKKYCSKHRSTSSSVVILEGGRKNFKISSAKRLE